MINIKSKKIDFINYAILASVVLFNMIMCYIKNIELSVFNYINFIVTTVISILFIKFLESYSNKQNINFFV